MPTQEETRQPVGQPNPSPPPEDDVSEAGNIFQRSDDEDPEEGGVNSHVIPKSPDEVWKRSASMRGGRGRGAPAVRYQNQKYSPPLSIGMPSWGSMEDHALEDYAEPVATGNIITPAVRGRLGSQPQIHPNMFRYPPSSPIKTSSPPSRNSPDEFEGGEEFIPPQSNTRRSANNDTIKTARVHEPLIYFPSVREPSIKPQFVREKKGTPPRHPSLVVDASTSHDSAETPGKSLQGGSVQVVGGDTGHWTLVSQSRSIESGEDWSATAASAPADATPERMYGPPPSHFRGPPNGPTYPPRYGMPPGYPMERYEREWRGPPGGPFPPPRYGYPYPHPPHGAPYPSNSIAVKQDDEEEPHPLLKDYNPHKDSVIRPQFQNTKKTPRFRADRDDDSSRGTQRKRRRRNPEEKLASAAAMAAAATAAAARAKQKKEQMAAGRLHEEELDSEDEIKTVGSVEDEDMPAAKRAAMASAVALRAAAGGSPCPPPKAAAEVDFDITDPPLTPIHPASDHPVLESASQMGEHDVLCGRGGGTNSQMGNRRYRALVRDFQPTYLMAKRREKPLMARSVVLVVRKRGGRFLRRDDTDGRLYEVGDEKAEAKTSQALREGLDVRATKTAANTLLGTENKKKKQAADAAPIVPIKKEGAATGAKPVIQFERPKSTSKAAAPIHMPAKPPIRYAADRPTSLGAPPPPHPYPPHGPSRYYPPGPYPYPPPYGHYACPPPPPGYGVYSTPPRSGQRPPPGSHAKEPNPFSPPRSNAF